MVRHPIENQIGFLKMAERTATEPVKRPCEAERTILFVPLAGFAEPGRSFCSGSPSVAEGLNE